MNTRTHRTPEHRSRAHCAPGPPSATPARSAARPGEYRTRGATRLYTTHAQFDDLLAAIRDEDSFRPRRSARSSGRNRCAAALGYRRAA